MPCNELWRVNNFWGHTKAGLIQLTSCDWDPTFAVHAIHSLTKHNDTFSCYSVFPFHARKHLVRQNTASLHTKLLVYGHQRGSDLKWVRNALGRWCVQRRKITPHHQWYLTIQKNAFRLCEYSFGYIRIQSFSRDTYLSSKGLSDSKWEWEEINSKWNPDCYG